MVKFEQISRKIAAEIRAGRHGSPADRFMTVRQLAERFGVALTTAQRVVKQLKEEVLLIADSTRSARIGPAAFSRATSQHPGGLADVWAAYARPPEVKVTD